MYTMQIIVRVVIHTHVYVMRVKKMSTKINIPKDFLVEEYINKGKSTRVIAKMLKCGRSTILRYLKKNNIEVRPCPKDKKVSIEFVTKQFAKEGYILTTTKYTGNQQKLYYICPADHPSHTTWNHWLNGTRCRRCKAEARRTKHKTINEIEYKWCSKCETWQKLSFFCKDVSTADNHYLWCNKCRKQDAIKNSKKIAERSKKYRKENPEKINARDAKRRAMKLNAMPEDASQKELMFYRAVCDETNGIIGWAYFNVEHFQPLTKGGQHHENNLQILEATLNLQKSNKWPLTPEEEIKYKGVKF